MRLRPAPPARADSKHTCGPRRSLGVKHEYARVLRRSAACFARPAHCRVMLVSYVENRLMFSATRTLIARHGSNDMQPMFRR